MQREAARQAGLPHYLPGTAIESTLSSARTRVPLWKCLRVRSMMKMTISCEHACRGGELRYPRLSGVPVFCARKL